MFICMTVFVGRIPSKDPSGMSVILPPIELPRLTTSSRVLSQEERNAALESLQQRKDVLVVGVAQTSSHTCWTPPPTLSPPL